MQMETLSTVSLALQLQMSNLLDGYVSTLRDKGIRDQRQVSSD